MRLYEYECEDCGARFDEMNDEVSRHVMCCAKCASSNTRMLISAPRIVEVFEFTTSDIDGKQRTFHSKSELADFCIKRWTPTNKPWPQMLDGISGPGVPYDVECDGAEGCQTKEELCKQRTENLHRQVEETQKRTKGKPALTVLPPQSIP